jgi:hypothetical protein
MSTCRSVRLAGVCPHLWVSQYTIYVRFSQYRTARLAPRRLTFALSDADRVWADDPTNFP